MDLRSWWSRLFATPHGRSGTVPLALLVLIGVGSLAALLAMASRFGRTECVALAAGRTFTSRDFNAAQAAWKPLGLTEARFISGRIEVPAGEADRYRTAWEPTGKVDDKSRWADVWQQANDRLNQFSGTRERDAAREISRAQVVSRLLEKLPDIETADIVWDESDAAGWRVAERARATVYLQAASGCSIGPDVVDAVRKAVSGSKANLAPEDVTVMDQTRMVAYGGTDVSAAAIYAAQSAGLFRDRLATGLEHLHGVKVRVHVLTSAGVGEGPTPIAVSIGVPDATVRALARLDGNEPAADSDSARNRRQVFKTVEQHVHQTIRAKVTQMLPPELTLVAQEQLVVETTPEPRAMPADVRATQHAGLSTWWQQHGLGVIAVVLGAGAVSMLRPRRRDAAVALETPTDSDNAMTEAPAAPLAALAHAPMEAASSPRAAASSINVDPTTISGENRGERRLEPMAQIPAGESATPAPLPTAGTTTPPAPIEQSDPPSRVAPPRETQLLRDVLMRLEESRTTASRSGPDDFTDEPGTESGPRQVLTGRIDAENAAVFDLETLATESPDRWRAIVSQVDLATWTRALFGASDNLRNRVQEHLAPADAARLSAELQSHRPVRLREIDAALHEVQAVYEQLRQDLPLQRSNSPRAAVRRRAA